MTGKSIAPGHWAISEADEGLVDLLAQSTGLCPATARLLVNRGISDPTHALRFLSPSLSDIPDPSTLPDMEQATERITRAIQNGETIGIFGDYDVDGVAGTALLCDFLRRAGSSPISMLPSRFGRGYGITPEDIEALAAKGARIIVTVDNGTRAEAAIDRAVKLGIDVIVTDHHEAEARPRGVIAAVNPKLDGGDSTLRDLCGCGVAFMLCISLRRRLRELGMFQESEPNLRSLLDLVALGTIADVVPLTGVNRILTSHGLSEIARAERAGIRALFITSDTDPSDISPNTVAFRLAPRINAAGRMGDAMMSLELMLSTDHACAMEGALRLERFNRERQSIEEKMLRQALAMIDKSGALDNSSAVVVHSEGWHIGVIGIVASKLADRLGRPAVVITRDVDPARGSVRSFGGINVFSALSGCSDELMGFGGHTLAAGLSIEHDRIDVFAERFGKACKELSAGAPAASLAIDAFIEPGELTCPLMDEISRLRPFGIGNPEPILAFRDVRIVEQRTVGNGHLKMKVAADGTRFDAIGFNMAERMPKISGSAAMAFTPQYNTWNGTTSIQLKLRDVAENL